MLKLPASIDTPQLLEAVRFEIERQRAWLSDSAIKHKAGVAPTDEPSRSRPTQEVLELWLDGSEPTITKLSELLAELRKLKPTIVHVTLAALPGASMRQTLVDWFRSLGRPDVLVSFTADRTIGGGIIIRTPNHMYDYSFRQRLTEGRSHLPEILKRAR